MLCWELGFQCGYAGRWGGNFEKWGLLGSNEVTGMLPLLRICTGLVEWVISWLPSLMVWSARSPHQSQCLCHAMQTFSSQNCKLLYTLFIMSLLHDDTGKWTKATSHIPWHNVIMYQNMIMDVTSLTIATYHCVVKKSHILCPLNGREFCKGTIPRRDY